MAEELDLSVIGSGSVIAPAGHGKTYSIGKTARDHPELRILALTHTHAGVAALRRQGPQSNQRAFRVETIASFALRIARAFPKLADWDESETFNVDAIQPSALQALSSSTVLGLVASAFDLIIVDEYQDCSPIQASIIDKLVPLVTTVVVGDPLQSIYDFDRGGSLEWTGSSRLLPQIEHLSTPHRWKHTNPALGEWLKHTRSLLEKGQWPVIERDSPIQAHDLEGEASRGNLYKYLHGPETKTIILPNAANPHALTSIAQSHRGLIRIAEKSDFNDVRVAAATIDSAATRKEVLIILIKFIASTKTKVRTSVIQNLQKNLQIDGKGSRSNHSAVIAAKKYLADGQGDSAVLFIRELLDGGQYTYRPDAQRLMLQAFLVRDSHPEKNLETCVKDLVERLHHKGSWRSTGTVVGTTLRLKGLEFDHAILVDPYSITSPKHLYVALTRGSKQLILLKPNSDAK